ncbi:predicted protein [Streptomyces sp. AA4]|nr:predicted protein [Streptomyces sp. AA4]
MPRPRRSRRAGPAVVRGTWTSLFAVLVQDFSVAAVELHGKPSSTEKQQELALAGLRKPVPDAERFGRVWETVRELSGAYEMNP